MKVALSELKIPACLIDPKNYGALTEDGLLKCRVIDDGDLMRDLEIAHVIGCEVVVTHLDISQVHPGSVVATVSRTDGKGTADILVRHLNRWPAIVHTPVRENFSRKHRRLPVKRPDLNYLPATILANMAKFYGSLPVITAQV